ncbi:hypothetical protein E8K88_13615 [Lampropedia aestuarii]|uniref:Uncharacterized protein n=1 Tax=Lampropedia aestuarii TaxID=2562762 RepID=A0A4S5BQC5_9BURK|nr:hypothetical protein [Lampropedia aestuarii]THJ31866.1 hypothetical protein E8K88_13615 [Lampropedia aestuarii]
MRVTGATFHALAHAVKRRMGLSQRQWRWENWMHDNMPSKCIFVYVFVSRILTTYLAQKPCWQYICSATAPWPVLLQAAEISQRKNVFTIFLQSRKAPKSGSARRLLPLIRLYEQNGQRRNALFLRLALRVGVQKARSFVKNPRRAASPTAVFAAHRILLGSNAVCKKIGNTF